MTGTEGQARPHRVQRSRQVKDSMLGAVYVGRPSEWGNPWDMEIGRTKALRMFREYAVRTSELHPDWLKPLKGKSLACWCPLNQPCHADILLELANR